VPKKQSPYSFDVLGDNDDESKDSPLPAGLLGEKPVDDPADLVEMRPRRRSSADRDYSKEKPHVTFRLIPKSLHEQVKKTARNEGVLLGELARFFFEFGIEQVDGGKLSLDPAAVRTGLSLYPEMRTNPAIQQSSRKNKWSLNTPHTYHGVTSGIKDRMDAIAEHYHVPVGEVARFFLEHGLAAYDRGELTLEKTVVETRNSLYPEDFAR
jgi:hypothetical protein